MADQIEIKVPDIGDFSDIPVIEVLVAVGDAVEAEQSLVTLESDKAMMEVPAPVAGIIRELRVAEGDTVSEGELVAVIEPGDVVKPEETETSPPAEPEPVQQTETKAPAPEPVLASQPAAKLARPVLPSAGRRQSPPVPMVSGTSNRFTQL